MDIWTSKCLTLSQMYVWRRRRRVVVNVVCFRCVSTSRAPSTRTAASRFIFASCTSFAFETEARADARFLLYKLGLKKKGLKCPEGTPGSRVRRAPGVFRSSAKLKCGSLSVDAESRAALPPPPLGCVFGPVLLTRVRASLLPPLFCVYFFAEVAWKWAPKQTVDGSQEEIHGNRVAPSGI